MISCPGRQQLLQWAAEFTSTMLAVTRLQLIVESWRSTKFVDDDPDSTLILLFSPDTADSAGGRIDLVHIDVSAHDCDGVIEGWHKYYWNPWREYLEKSTEMIMQQLGRSGFRCLILVGLLLGGAPCFADDAVEIPLWKDGAPGAPTKPQDEPTLYLTRPAAGAATDAAVIVCPGGGYGHLSMEKEGSKIAEWLNSFGVTAFVLRYRHGGTGHRHPTPMLDGQRAIRIVRSRAAEWGLDPNKIGVMGFSAGGHLTSTLGTHFDAGDSSAADPIDQASSRPDFLILCYPVISLAADYTHTGSRDSLLGKNPDADLLHSLSNETQVTHETPPTFLFHTDEDTAVPAENSIVFYEALRKAGVPAELHIYRKGGHGTGLAQSISGTRDWPARCKAWLQTQGLVDR